MKSFKIAVLKGDGIGPEIIDEAKKVLDALGSLDDFELVYTDYLVGGVAIDREGVPLPDETLQGCLESDAVLLGAIGGPKWDNLARELRPESGLLKLRQELNVYTNLRPITVYDELLNESTIKPEVLKGSDFVIVRELISGIYFGQPREKQEQMAYNTMRYTKSEIEQVVKKAFEIAMSRKKHLCSVDKANVLEVSQLWRDTVIEMSAQYPEVTVSHMYVDNAAMQLVRAPKQFDVMVTTNMFGDILSDCASMLTGSIGMLPSASLDESGKGMYEPIHGSAPDIAGQDIANPLATILSVAMMLRYTLDEPGMADRIEVAVSTVLDQGLRTGDIYSEGMTKVGTSQMGDAVVAAL
mgnify:CR=1 FL=1